jgi:antitoxin component YwqK of YwqJK toxin-antitoxin module
MKIITTLFLIALTASNCHSQDTTFFNSDWKPCKKDTASFYRVVSENGSLFKISDFYITNIIQMQGQSSVKDSLFKQGDFYYYNNKGVLIENSSFINNIKEGKSTQYFENGKPKRITNFKNGSFNGETFYYNSKGILIGKGFAKDNYWYGKWEKYNDDGSFLTNLFYDDKFIFKELNLKTSTPHHIWLYFDKVENDSLIKYLCRPTNSKSDA